MTVTDTDLAPNPGHDADPRLGHTLVAPPVPAHMARRGDVGEAAAAHLAAFASAATSRRAVATLQRPSSISTDGR